MRACRAHPPREPTLAKGLPGTVLAELDLPLLQRAGIPPLDRCAAPGLWHEGCGARLLRPQKPGPEPWHADAVWISGMVQTVFYCDFFYYYLKSFKAGEKLRLPN